jgi:hypothetical protein
MARNKRRWLLGTAFGLVVLVVAWFEPTHVIRGWLRGEAFYDGRPTSYWAAEIERWEWDGKPIWYRHCEGTKQYRHRPLLPGRLGALIPEPEAPWPALLDGDKEGLPVLNELLEHPSPHVASWAEEGIARISSGEKGPGKTDYLFGKTSDEYLAPMRVYGTLEP